MVSLSPENIHVRCFIITTLLYNIYLENIILEPQVMIVLNELLVPSKWNIIPGTILKHDLKNRKMYSLTQYVETKGSIYHVFFYFYKICLFEAQQVKKAFGQFYLFNFNLILCFYHYSHFVYIIDQFKLPWSALATVIRQ